MLGFGVVDVGALRLGVQHFRRGSGWEALRIIGLGPGVEGPLGVLYLRL